MPDYTLISHHLCPYVQRAVIVLLEKNIEHKRLYINLADKPDWFAGISPLGKVPILRTVEKNIFESQVIIEYLDEVTSGSLYPGNLLEKARHRSWIEFGTTVLNAIGGFYSAMDEDAFTSRRDVLRRLFAQVEQEIEGPFFGGDTFQVIDAVWAPVFRYFNVFDRVSDFEIMTGLDQVLAWRQALGRRTSVIKAVPEGYEDRLHQFLVGKGSYLSSLIS